MVEQFEVKPIKDAEETAYFEGEIKSSIEVTQKTRGKPFIRVKLARGEEHLIDDMMKKAVDIFLEIKNKIDPDEEEVKE